MLSLLLILLLSELKPVEKDVFGWIERVKLFPSNVIVNAKLDTGADNCSIHAEDVKVVKRGKKDFVNFTIINRSGVKHRTSLPIKRIAKIKRTGGIREERYVVRMAVCIGDKYQEVDVSLEDRSDFSYAMLVGRNFLEGQALVDSSAMHRTEPDCKFK